MKLTDIPLGDCWVVDVEADGLLDEATQIWIEVYRNALTDEVLTRTSGEPLPIDVTPSTFFIGHNIIGFDNLLVSELSEPWPSEVRLIDTFLLSQILSPNRNLHSLDSYAPDQKVQNEDWSSYTPVIRERCISDTLITKDLFLSQLKILDSWECDDHDFIWMEQQVFADVARQAQDGCPINEPELLGHIEFLEVTIEGMNSKVQDILGSYFTDIRTNLEPFTTKGQLKKVVSNWAESAGVDPDTIDGPFTRFELNQVRLTQHARVKDRLLDLGWQPTTFTDKGSPKLPKGDEWDEIAKSTGSAELSEIALYGGYKNRLDILLGWKSKLRAFNGYKVVTHGAFTCGTPTSRFRHQTIVNVPRPSSLFGNEMRSLIYCPHKDYVQVGWDLSGIELRMLAHYMGDKPFIDLVADPEGDIHSFFWKKVTHLVASRDDWKNVFYGYSYGASDPKLGSLCTALPMGKRVAKAGTELRDTIETSTPSLGQLVANVQKASLRGYIKGLDGRRVVMKTNPRGRKVKIGKKWVANPNGVVTKDALNRLLQSGAAIVFKRAVKIILDNIGDLRVKTLIYYHDEGQNFVHKDDVEAFKDIINKAVIEAGEYYGLRIPLDCDIMVGRNWMECH